MRLSEIYFKLADYEKNLKFDDSTPSKTGGKSVKNLNTINEMLKELKNYEIFSQDIQRVESLGDYIHISYSPVVIPDNIYATYSSVFNNIKIKLSMLYYLYNVTGQVSEANLLCMSFPETSTSLIDFQKFSNNVTKALNQIGTIPKFNGSITFKGVESGSEWFYFSLSGEELIVAITFLVPLVKNILVEAYTAYKTMSSINFIHNSNKSLKDIRDALIRKCIQDEETFKKLSFEERERVIKSCIMLSDEIVKGSEIELRLLNQLETTNNSTTEKLLKSSLEEIKLLMAAHDSNQPTNDETNNETNSDDNN